MTEDTSAAPPPLPHSPELLSLAIWPPSQRTRDAVISRLVETLTTPSVLSKRYGVLPSDVATDTARRIEAEAFEVAAVKAKDEPATIEEGLEVLQLYSKEISSRMLDSVKARVSEGMVGDSAPAASVVSCGGDDEVSPA